MKKIIVFLLIIFYGFANAQSDFRIIGNKKTVTIPFDFVNNVILIPIKVNNQELTFILDTGVSKSLLFNIKSATDSVKLKQTKKIRIKGLGKGVYFDAIKSKNNLLRLKEIICPNFELYLILNTTFDFSARLGKNVNGLIGTDLLRHFIVEINYSRKRVKFTKKENYTYKKCRKCVSFNLEFNKLKPYINATVSTTNNKTIPVKLLIDSGSGESVWLFNDSNPQIKIPTKNIDGFLGKGLSGNIYGKKAKLDVLKLKEFELKNMLVSYPDSTSILYTKNNFGRNGTLGATILKRFNIILDYQNSRITLKKNSNFNEPFFYDKSGLEIIHNGTMLVKESKATNVFGREEDNAPIFTFTYNYKFKNSFLIYSVRENSVAAIAGLQVNDLIYELNGKPIYEYTLQEITQILGSENGKRITLLVSRNGFQYRYKFKLKDLL